MVPQAFEWLATLPRQANGKVARDALPAPDFGREESVGLVPARSDLEGKLLSIWSDVLQQEKLGIHDDFFALGGHSLLATRVIARLRNELGIDVPLINLFEYPTIARFAAALTLIYSHKTGGDEIKGQPRDDLIPVTRLH